MGSGPVEVPEMLAQHLVEMALAQDEDVIQALASDAPKEALHDCIRTRGLNRRTDDPDPACLGHPRKCRPELGVVVSEQERRPLIEGGSFAELLGDPGIARMTGHAHMYDAARGMLDDEESEEGTEDEVRRLEEVTRPDALGLGAEEGRPSLPARS